LYEKSFICKPTNNEVVAMSKTLALTLVLVFLTASSIIVVLLVSGATGEDTWVEKTPMHQARESLGVAVVNGKIYAIGGSGNSGIVGTNEEYDPKTDSWIYKATMPTARYDFAIAVYQNKIYCIGGCTNIADEGQTITAVNEVYDPATDTWESKTPMPTARFSLEANVVGSKIYLIGGYKDRSGLSLNEVYYPTNNSWTTEAPIPQVVAGYVSAVADEKLYIIDSGNNQIFDTLDNTWSQGESPPLSGSSSVNTPWGAVATTGINAPKRLYVFTEKTVEIYNPDLNSWVLGADLPTDRVVFGVSVVNDLIYVIGGFSETYQNFPEDWINGPKVTIYDLNEQYTPFGYGTVPPAITVHSPMNLNYSGIVDLNFTTNRPVDWVGYSLDGQYNVTVNGNTSLSGLAVGLHNVTVYANDSLGNVGSSETVNFTVAEPLQSKFFPAVPVAAVSVVVILVAAGLLVYHKKHKHNLVKKP
jgi:hypothetical protein